MIVEFFVALIALTVFLFLATAAVAPIETLTWWSGWNGDDVEDETTTELADDVAAHEINAAPSAPDSRNNAFIVYLSGVASISGRFLTPREQSFVTRLRAAAPETQIVTDVFPYSPAGTPLLASPRLFDRLWRRVQRLKIRERRSALAILINIRNIFQVLISADHRYGPIFNQGVAGVIEKALVRAGYDMQQPASVYIVGYSGGAQVAIGAAPFLSTRLRAPLEVISVGGVLASDPGIHFLRRLHLVSGALDRLQHVGAVIFPERWSVMAHSEWNRALRSGVIKKHSMPKMTHAGVKGYFGRPPINGVSNAERTMNAILSIIDENKSPASKAPDALNASSGQDGAGALGAPGEFS